MTSTQTSIDWTAVLVDQAARHWTNQLRPRFEGLSDEEYLWEPTPGAWNVHPRGQGATETQGGSGELTIDWAYPEPVPAPMTTIAWRLAHLIQVLGSPAAAHFQHGVSDSPGIEFVGTAEAALRQLDDGYEAWMADVRDLGVAGLSRPQGALSPPQFADAPIARLVMYSHVELIHHGAEICLLRDLYRGSW